MGKLDVDCDDLVGITIRETAEEGAEELPLAAWFARADDLAMD